MTTDPKAILARSMYLEGVASYLQRMREQERAHLARELHDELGALLMGAKLDVACLVSRLGGQSPEVDLRLQHLGDTLNRGISLKSSIVEGLCPSTLANLGLVASLEILAREFTASSGIRIEADLQAVDLDELTQLAVYRLVQESLTNVGKYAAASAAKIVLRQSGSEATVSVRDNGVGFDVARLNACSHGLAGMRHRVEDRGGRLIVNSSPGQGTQIVAMLPSPGTPRIACVPPRAELSRAPAAAPAVKLPLQLARKPRHAHLFRRH